ncbi:MAG: aspartate--tRNA ligase [Flavobacteriales bacterium]|nr:aspartate--tRNA ligase [Flavobacteriales bacterium]MBK6944582.1 aspartate--tRNA ligase [Flavobacteriales bacterium]MBK7241267.1 aspartate--tRNA ligase [Flavobacteriales bacterium]MBK7295562.1 aspartate--tRNA ligase [Flavobacteriales bacterium]MBP9139792.1 aspartate--tRNA ligase [Flavobacteriales bacterium]
MYRTHTCGELRPSQTGQTVTLAGWVQRTRELGGLTFVDLRDRFGITQLSFNSERDRSLRDQANSLGREFVVQATGVVTERESKNKNIPTGEIELVVTDLKVLNTAKTPPFTIEEDTDGGDELRMKYRYLDLRRNSVRKNMELRHRMAIEVRNYLSNQQFLEVETPVLIKSTPEGARDFVVPSRMNPGEFYALPQSPQTFKQLLMVAGMDRYFQIVKCFRDEDLRADRQPEFTQIDCEMAFVDREDILQTFEGLAKHLFKTILGKDMNEPFLRMNYDEAMRYYGCDKPDLRFGMRFHEMNEHAKGKGFKVFDDAELVVGINAEGCAGYSRKQTDALIDFVKRPQIGATGIIFLRWNAEGLKSTVDKFYGPDELKRWAEHFNMKEGDFICIMAGPADKTRKQLNELRLHIAETLGLRDPNVFKPLWVVDFPLLEKDEDERLPAGRQGRWHAMHHPFTSPIPEHAHLLESDPGSVKANAYDLVINGTEIGGGSIRIHDRAMQEAMFRVLGFTDEEARYKFGFLLDAFEFGAPPHGGAAFGFDRWVSLFGGRSDIREFIAFPKNNSGRDVMIDAPSMIDDVQLKELGIVINKPS